MPEARQQLAADRVVNMEFNPMIKTVITLGLALTGVLITGCGTNGSNRPTDAPTPASHSSARVAVQHVSDETICDLLFRDNGVMVKSVALMSQRQTSRETARLARRYAGEADRIGAHARVGMATKVQALSHSLRDYADWVDSPAGGFKGDDYAIAGLELGNTCGPDLPKSQSNSNNAPAADRPPAQSQARHLTYFDVTMNSHLHGEGFWAANLTACYVRPHPEANPDGTTRVSTDPWSVLIERPNGAKLAGSPLCRPDTADSPA